MNRALIATLVGVLAAGLCAVGVRASSYEPTARVAAIEAALTELQKSPDSGLSLRETIRDLARSRCRGSDNALVVRCNIEAARETCGKREPDGRAGCSALADVIVTNALGESSFITESERYALFNKSENFRQALDDELDRRYATLAASCLLSGAADSAAPDATPAAIDSFCIERAQKTRLPWQRCTAALIWFIGKEATP